ncbi:MAG: hypothetical protein HZC41_14830 [Chloroflexi bacterium]|nr:hypothetical protein [Chloroflexota bacterium]
MPQAYAASPTPSTDSVPPRQWRQALALLALVIVSGAALAVALALGLADPPRAGSLAWETTSMDVSWPLDKDLGGNPRLWVLRAPVEAHAPPFTIEIEATVLNLESSAWGLWVETRHAEYLFLVGYEDYVSTGTMLDWRNFIHIRPDTNQLYLHIEQNGMTTFRVNGEIAWRGQLDLPDTPLWGLATFTNTRFDLRSARLYAP